ncbi:Uncharacterized protein Rs2_13647 [Raphanus sativus]|nr:Uncharacterized protein Rs2_13647 [Raphanus sativus]
MSDKFKPWRPPRKQLPRRSLLPEPSGESSTDDEANEVERKVPFKVPLIMRPRPFGYIDEDDSTDSEATDNEEPTDEVDSTVSDATSPEELKDTAKKNDDAANEPPNKKRKLDRRKIKTPRRFISPEAEVNQTDANP